MNRNKMKLAGAYAFGASVLSAIAIDSYSRGQLCFGAIWTIADIGAITHSALYTYEALYMDKKSKTETPR